jgi:hypothetical protein
MLSYGFKRFVMSSTRNLETQIKDIFFKSAPDNNYQYAEVMVNGKTGSRHIPLINSIPFLKDYLDHEHPQPSNPNLPLICGIRKSLGGYYRYFCLGRFVY